MSGTSPRVWGKPFIRLFDLQSRRNIPTRVGKTCITCRPLDQRSEHPHACGENVSQFGNETRKPGTSPRVWGKLLADGVDQADIRNIPTRVGKTATSSAPIRQSSEHPHACGENRASRRLNPPRLGTSPRVWGKRCSTRTGRRSRRNIPTRVGKTAHNRLRPGLSAEHPHACGENGSYTIR